MNERRKYVQTTYLLFSDYHFSKYRQSGQHLAVGKHGVMNGIEQLMHLALDHPGKNNVGNR